MPTQERNDLFACDNVTHRTRRSPLILCSESLIGGLKANRAAMILHSANSESGAFLFVGSLFL
jgi:hypothetical protein